MDETNNQPPILHEEPPQFSGGTPEGQGTSVPEQNPPHSGNLPVEHGGERPVVDHDTPLSHEIQIPDSPAALTHPQESRPKSGFTKRQKLFAGGALAATIAAGVGAAEYASHHPRAVAIAGNPTPGKDVGSAENTQPTNTPSNTPTSLPSNTETHQQTVTNWNVDLSSEGIDKDTEGYLPGLENPDAPLLQEYFSDPMENPGAAVTAFLSEFSYITSTEDDANAQTVIDAMTDDAGIRNTLMTIRDTARKDPVLQNKEVWYWSEGESGDEASFKAVREKDGSTVVTLVGGKILAKNFDRTGTEWQEPDTSDKSGAFSVTPFKITFAPVPEDATNAPLKVSDIQGLKLLV